MLKAKKIILITIVVALSSVLFVSLPVSASSNVYTIDFQKPLVNDYNSYIEVLCKKPNNEKVVIVYTFSILDLSIDNGNSGRPLTSDIYVSADSSKLTVGISAYPTGFKFVYTWIRSDTNVYDVYTYGKETQFQKQLYIESGWTVLSVKGYGNIRYNTVDNGINDFTVVYGENSALYNILKGVEIASNNGTDRVIANENENTQAIIDNQNQLAQNEKNETQTQGQSSVDDLSGAVDDKSSGFVNSIRSLVSAMSYNGTECAWTVPEVKLPAINGVMQEVKLMDSQPIDFAYWVNKIPSNILLLVRSLLTIGLIVYCFKELYSTISYVLTLKGGGNSE